MRKPDLLRASEATTPSREGEIWPLYEPDPADFASTLARRVLICPARSISRKRLEENLACEDRNQD